jgi:hypothetical protein
VDKLPVSANSAQWTAEALLAPIGVSFQWGTNLVDNFSPLTPQTFYYTTLLNQTLFPIPALPDKKRETGAYTTDGMNDHHMLVLNHQSCQFYETYQEGVPNAVCPECTAASGWTYNSGSYTQPSQATGGGTTDAAGMPLAALTFHLSEIQDGAIRHAMRFTSCTGCISNQFVWPAIYSTGWEPGGPPMGTRFRLKASFDVRGFPPAAQIVLNALKQYGMILADIGTAGQISAASDVTENPAVVREVQSISPAAIGYSNFEVVDESSLMLNVNSSVVNPNNEYEKPLNQALLTITDTGNPANVVTLPIALQGVTVGTPDPSITVQAGTPAFPIQSWVNGTWNRNVTWSISSPAAGSIDASGNYTAPATVDVPFEATLTVASEADSTATARISLTVFPSGPVRIDTGSPTPTVDSHGNTWMADLAFETGSFNTVNDSYPSNAWGVIANPVQIESFMYTWGDDIQYRMHVPNGSYLATFTFGVGGCTKTYGGVFDNGLITGAMHLESQGQIVLHNWNFSLPIDHTCRTPTTITIPANVTDTNLNVALRALGGNDAHTAPLLNSVTITQSSVSPAFTIDAQQRFSVLAGTSLQLYPVSWFAPDVPVVWSILSGPGTISQTGLYTAPPSLSGGTSTVRIQIAAANGSAKPGTISLTILK